MAKYFVILGRLVREQRTLVVDLPKRNLTEEEIAPHIVKFLDSFDNGDFPELVLQ